MVIVQTGYFYTLPTAVSISLYTGLAAGLSPRQRKVGAKSLTRVLVRCCYVSGEHGDRKIFLVVMSLTFNFSASLPATMDKR